MQTTTGIVTLVVNGVIKGFLGKLELIQKSKYHSTGVKNTFLAIFLTLFFNIALVPFIAMFRFKTI